MIGLDAEHIVPEGGGPRPGPGTVESFRNLVAGTSRTAAWLVVVSAFLALVAGGGRTDVALGLLLGGVFSIVKLRLSAGALLQFAQKGGRAATRSLLCRRGGVYVLTGLVVMVACWREEVNIPAAVGALFLTNVVLLAGEMFSGAGRTAHGAS